MAKRLFLLVASAFVAVQSVMAAGVSPTGKSDGADVRAALARHDLFRAGIAYDALVEARLPPKQTNRPDPLLDRLLVELMVTQGAQPPRPMLQRLANDAASPDRIHSLLLLATAEESGGDEDQAVQHYNSVMASPIASMDQLISARLGTARLKLETNAAASVAILRKIDPATAPATRRWEIDLALSRALAIAEPLNLSAQETQLEKAWAEATDADIADHAVVRVAGDRAIRAAREGDRSKLVTLLSIDRTNRGANTGQNLLASDLPVCGENGVLHDDLAVIEVQRIAPPERPGISLVWANRPDVGQLFVGAARRSGRLSVMDGTVAQFALRCRSTPAPDYAVSVELNDIIGGWMTGKGAYPLTSNDSLDNVTQLASMLANRTTRYGADSIMRLPVLLQLTRNVFPQVQADEQARNRINELVNQITAVLNANDAPQDMKLLWRMSSVTMALATRMKTTAQAQADIQALLVTAAGNPAVSRDFLYNLAIGVGKQSAVSTDFNEAVLTAMIRLFDHEPKRDPRARALAMQLYIIRARNGNLEGAQPLLAQHDLPADLCVLFSPSLRYVASDIRNEDYPSDLAYTGIVGLTPSEFDLDPSGRAVGGRLLVSDPPYIFDDVTRHGITTIRYDPPRRAGMPQACRGFTQSVRWQLPN